MKLLWVVCLVCALAAPVVAQDNSSVESKIIAMEKAWNQAYKFRDKKALGQILHDSMVIVNDDGSLRLREYFWQASMRRSRPTSNKRILSRSPCMSLVMWRLRRVSLGKRVLKTAKLT